MHLTASFHRYHRAVKDLNEASQRMNQTMHRSRLGWLE